MNLNKMIGFIIFFIILFVVNLTIGRVAIDWHVTFYPSIINILNGISYITGGQFLLPWGAWSYLPLGFLPTNIGLAILRAQMFVAAAFGYRLFSNNKQSLLVTFGLLTVIMNPFMFDLWNRGQVDFWITFMGVILGYLSVIKKNPYILGLSLLLLSGKPPNGLTVGILYLIEIPSLRKRLLSLVFAGLTLVLSLLLHPGWMIEIWEKSIMGTGPIYGYRTTLFRFLDMNRVPNSVLILMLGLILIAVLISYFRFWESLDLLDKVLWVMAVTFMVTPYSTTYRIMILIVPFIGKIMSSRTPKTIWFGVLVYILTFAPILRPLSELGHRLSYIDYYVVIIIFCVVMSGILFKSDTLEPIRQTPESLRRLELRIGRNNSLHP